MSRRGFPEGLGGLPGDFRVPGGCCADAQKGLPARKSLPSRWRGRDWEGFVRLVFLILCINNDCWY